MKIPERVPEKAFYYHYKHDPAKSLEDYAYEVLGIGRHSEDESYYVVYRPLYKNTYLEGADCCVRPLDMWMGDVTQDGKTFPRFQKSTDPEVITQLVGVRDKMYP